MSDTPYTFEKKNIPTDALEQGTYWYDRKGNLYVIENMSQQHAVNAMSKLIRIHKAKVFGTPLYKALTARASKH